MACTWPEEVLRVPRKCGDPALLRAAYRRCSMAVHPDKCSAGRGAGAGACCRAGDWHGVLLPLAFAAVSCSCFCCCFCCCVQLLGGAIPRLGSLLAGVSLPCHHFPKRPLLLSCSWRL